MSRLYRVNSQLWLVQGFKSQNPRLFESCGFESCSELLRQALPGKLRSTTQRRDEIEHLKKLEPDQSL
jgi:hypothetical protein